jgi:cytochrome c peroxidase
MKRAVKLSLGFLVAVLSVRAQATLPDLFPFPNESALLQKVKGPILRGLAGRAPYFHNGSALTLNDVVKFYNQRFNLGLTNQNQQDLVAFLSSL